MPIPFHLSDEIESLGEAAFLHLEPTSGTQMRGALLFLNALGEPKEFVYNRVALDGDALWRPADRQTGAARRLISSLLDAAQGWPLVLFCRADAVAPGVFGADGALLALDVPVARLALSEPNSPDAPIETADAHGNPIILTADWAMPPGPPIPESAAAALLALLTVRGLLWEPFDRAGEGLTEAMGRLRG